MTVDGRLVFPDQMEAVMTISIHYVQVKPDFLDSKDGLDFQNCSDLWGYPDEEDLHATTMGLELDSTWSSKMCWKDCLDLKVHSFVLLSST